MKRFCGLFAVLAIAPALAGLNASAETEPSAQYAADRAAAYDACIAPYRERDRQSAVAFEKCQESGEGFCWPAPSAANNAATRTLCSASADAKAEQLERVRFLAQSAGATGTNVPKTTPATTSVKLPDRNKPAIKTPVTLPAAVRPKSGLTLTVPVKVTNFHTSWNGQQLASGDASMIVACRVIANDYSVTGEVHSGFTELPPIAEGGSLDTSVDVFIDANVLGLGDDYGNTAECLLMRPDMDKSEDTFLGITMENAPMRACGEWNNNPAQCRVVIY